MVDGHIKYISKAKVDKRGRELIDKLIEQTTKSERGEGRWELVNWVVE